MTGDWHAALGESVVCHGHRGGTALRLRRYIHRERPKPDPLPSFAVSALVLGECRAQIWTPWVPSAGTEGGASGGNGDSQGPQDPERSE